MRSTKSVDREQPPTRSGPNELERESPFNREFGGPAATRRRTCSAWPTSTITAPARLRSVPSGTTTTGWAAWASTSRTTPVSACGRCRPFKPTTIISAPARVAARIERTCRGVLDHVAHDRRAGRASGGGPVVLEVPAPACDESRPSRTERPRPPTRPPATRRSRRGSSPRGRARWLSIRAHGPLRNRRRRRPLPG